MLFKIEYAFKKGKNDILERKTVYYADTNFFIDVNGDLFVLDDDNDWKDTDNLETEPITLTILDGNTTGNTITIPPFIIPLPKI